MDGRGPALGMLDDVHYTEARLELAGDDRLLLLSDGLVERGARRPRRRASSACATSSPPARPTRTPCWTRSLSALNPPGTDDVTLLGIART